METEQIHKMQALLTELEEANRKVESIRLDLLSAASDVPEMPKAVVDLPLEYLELVKKSTHFAHSYITGQIQNLSETENT